MTNYKVCNGFSLFIKAVFILFILVMIFATLWIRSAIISTEYKLSTLEQQKKELLIEKKLLIAEKASLISIAKLETTSQKEMIFPDRKKVVFIQGSPEVLVKSVNYKKER
jgi:cell division protein FtsL